MKNRMWRGALLLSAAYSQSFYRYDLSDCIGIYSSASVPGQEAFVEVAITPTTAKGSLAAAIFRFQDRFNIQSMEFVEDFLICDEKDVERGTCLASEVGKFHIKDSSSTRIPILNEAISWGDSANWTAPSANVTLSNKTFKLKYGVLETGFYCIFLGSEVLEEQVCGWR